jgi:hypothetical protein
MCVHALIKRFFIEVHVKFIIFPLSEMINSKQQIKFFPFTPMNISLKNLSFLTIATHVIKNLEKICVLFCVY